MDGRARAGPWGFFHTMSNRLRTVEVPTALPRKAVAQIGCLCQGTLFKVKPRFPQRGFNILFGEWLPFEADKAP